MKGYPYVEYQKSEVRYFHGMPFGITRSSFTLVRGCSLVIATLP